MSALRPLTLFLFVALAAAPGALAYERPVELNDVAAVYSLGAGEVRCPSELEWETDPVTAFSYGYAYTNIRADYAVLSPRVCAGALGVAVASIPLWEQALGVLVLTHESFHLRHWRYRRNEGKVECQAMVYFTDAAVRLGATGDQAQALYPYALAYHLALVETFPQYRDRTCLLPPWRPPSS